MTTIVIPNVPPELYARLERDAARAGRTVGEELLSKVGEPTPPAELTPSAGVPDGLAYIPSPEIVAPYDLESETPWRPVTARQVPPRRLECWFDEDKVAE